MNFILNHLLTFILFTPTAAALLMFFIPKGREKFLLRFALIASLIPFIFAIRAWILFSASQAEFQFQEQTVWFPTINATYHLGMDGLSLTMVLLTTLLTPLAILASYKLKDRVRSYLQLFLLLETGMLGVFLSLDLMLFFVFWEAGLVPMYFIINQWGSQNKNYASLKFILFTMGGSLGLLLGIQLIGVLTGTYDLIALYSQWPALNGGTLMGLDTSVVKTIIFFAFVIAFAVKVPIFPFHTWLPDAHTEAPTAGSMILAGVMLKLGAFGFLRLVLPLFPAESSQYAWILAGLATLAVIWGAFGAWGQTDFKRLVAYSSINHMGFVILGIAVAAAAQNTSDGQIALDGAILQMLMHGLSSAGMFFLVGVVYERTHTRDLNDFGGLLAILPRYGGLLIFMSMASLGLPGLGGFIAEFLVVRGSFPVFSLATTLSVFGLFFTGVYILKALKLVLHGPLNLRWQGKLTDISWGEVLVISPLMVLLLLTGIYPAWIMELINHASLIR